MRKILFLISLLVFIFPSSVSADDIPDISGTWAFNMTGPAPSDQPDPVMDLVIRANGGKLTISVKHPKIGDMKGSGTLIETGKGYGIFMHLDCTEKKEVGYVAFEFTGAVYGNKMAGTREIKVTEPTGVSPGPSDGDAQSSDAQSGGPKGVGPSMDDTSRYWIAVKK